MTIVIEYADPRIRALTCESILRALPQWFGIETAVLSYIREAAERPMFVAVDASTSVGFITLHRHAPTAWEIHAIGVLPNYHRRGLGRRLLEEAEQWLRTEKAEFLTVKTLSASAEYEPYERTRAYYLAMGFIPLMELPTLWSPEDPCMILTKPLTPSRS